MMTELLLDYDGAKFPADFEVRLGMVTKLHSLHVDCIRIDRTRHGWHVIVVVRGRRLAILRVVLLQALLGSDWKRECYNSRRASAWRRVPEFWTERANVLYGVHVRTVP